MCIRDRTKSVEPLRGLTERTGFLGLSEYVVAAQSLGAFDLDPGDVLVLYSDGVSETKNAHGALFGLPGIEQALVERAEEGAQAVIDGVMSKLRHHGASGDLKKHGGRFADDVSLVVLKKL